MKDIFNKRQRFSIRKFSVGVASVLIGVSLFAPTQGVLASTENSLPSVEKREAVQPILDNQNNPSSELDTRDVPIGSTRTTEPGRSGDTENNSLTTRDFVAGEDRSSTPAVRAASVPSSDIKKYELTEEDAKKIKAGIIGSEGDKYDSLLLDGEQLKPNGYTDNDYLSDKDEIYIYEKNGKKYVGYNSHPLLEDTDGDGIIDSDEKSDEKLKWNVSERDMIMFMELSYRDDAYIDKVLNHKKILTEADLYKKSGDTKPRYEFMMMNNELAPYWKRKKSYHTSSGLDAVLFETKSDFPFLPNGTAQVLAFRGTSDGKDIVADGVLGTGSNPQQGKDAEEIMRELAKDKSITNLYLTGHSLGGYLVQRAMVEAYELAYSDRRVMSNKEQLAYRNFYDNVLKKGTTFNAPKVRTGLFSSSEFWQKGLDSKKIAKAGKMTHYIVDNDSVIGKSVSNDRDVVINVGPTRGGHSSRSYFENDLINREPKFISGKRVSLDGIGFRNPKITTAKSLEKVGETAVYSKRGDDIIKSTTVSIKDPDTGQITKNTLDEVFKKDGAKSTVVVTSLEPIVRYEKDATKVKGEANVTTAGTSGTRTVTTTYTVNPTDGSLIPHEEPAVVVPSKPTVVKVPAKDEVAYLKEGDDVVKKTTTYAVNASTGALTPTEKKEIFKQNGAKAKVVVTPLQPSVRYERDATRAKGGKNVTTAGTSGTRTVTTTYTVNSTDGSLIPHEEPAVVVPSKPTVVKVPAKDEVTYLKEGDDVVKKTITYAVNASTGALTPTVRKDVANPKGAKSKVVVTPLKPSVRYEKDATKVKGEAKITVAGTSGTSTVTTTYTVNPTDGSLIPHKGKPVIKQSTPTVVKVPAKDEVTYLKEGDDVVKKTITYAVNASTGSLTSIEKKEVFKQDGAKSKVVVTPIEPIVRYEKDESRDKDSEPVRKEGTPGEDTITTTYTVDPKTGAITPTVGKPVRTKEPTNTIVKVAAKDKVETTELPSPKKYVKDDTRDKGQDNVEEAGQAGSRTTTTTYEVNPENGTITERVGEPVVVNPTATIVKVAAKDKVVEAPIEPEVEYVRDGEREVGTPNERVEGAKGKTVTTTTYDVDSNDGHITEHVGNPVVTPAGKTIVKVGAKTKVEQSKDSEGRDVIDTTTYAVDPKTGKVTPTTVRTYGKTKEPTVEKRVVPSPVVYEKDDTKEKGTAPTTVKGEDGEDTITTTYTVDPNTGKITASEGQPVRTKEPTNTIVKVAAKDKVVEAPIEPEVEYVRDGEREVGTPNERVEGAKGKTVTTTTYDVDPKDGHITEHVGNPAVTPAGKTIVKVGAKTKVEQSKDSEGHDVIDTTTYEVDPKTGKVTPTTVRTYGKTKEPTVEKRVVPSPVVYEKDDTKEKGTAPTTVKGEDGEDTITTTYTVDPNTGKITASEGQPVRTKEPTNTIVKVAAKDKVETTELPSPKKYVKDDTRDKGQDNVEEAGQAGSRTTTTTYEVNPENGTITERVGEPVVVNPTATIVKVAAKDKVVEAPIEPEVEYVRDGEREVGTPNERVEGAKGKTVTTTTYDVDPKDGHITEHVGNPAVTPAGKTIVKVGAKTKVEQSKDSEGRDVIDTTTYEVDPKTGKVTPTTVRTYGKTKEPTVEKRVVPSPVVYEKDDTKEKGTAPTTVKGEDGEDTITTTYTVDPNTGKITASEGQPVRTKEPTNTIVKVAAKDKVVEAPIEPEVEYVRDGEREVGTPNERVEGAKGKTVTTTTYDVDSKDGHITEHVGNPVVTPAGKTIVKVGAKTKVEQSKDSEGRDVIDTTTYAVDPKTGKVTPTTVRTYGKTKEPTVEKRVVPSPVVYEKDDTKEKGTAPTTVKGEDGEDTITTTYTVDPNTGKITASEGQPVRTKEPTNTIVKVAAKDKVETTELPSPKKYVKDDTRDKGQDNVEEAGQAGSRTTTTTYEVNPENGTITERVGEPVVVNPTATIVKVAAKDKVVEAPIEPEVEYVRDGEREVGTPNERVEGAKGKTVTTTTYDVDSKDGHITEHVGNPVVTPAGKTIVKVGAKTKVEQSKDSEGRDVIDTTTYEVDPKTGKVTPTTVRTYGKTKEPTVEKRVVPSPVVYEKDDTKEKGTAPTTVKGEDGEDTITTTYTVDPNTGKITASEGQPVRTKEPTNTIVKVAAKDKVETTELPSPKKYVKDDTRDKGQDNVEEAGQAGSRTTTTTYEVNPENGTITERVGEPVVVNPTATIVKVAAKDKVVEAPIEPEVEYVRDGEREVGTPNERVEGAKGKTVTTTTYDVDSKDGHITEHVGNPVVTPAGKTIVKVGAKTKVEQSKDSEGRDVIDTTTYAVDPKTGKVTPTTVRTYGKTKEPTVEKRVVPSPVVYEKDDTKEKGTAPTTVKGEDGEDTITTTYTVDPNTGKITASEGQPVRTKEPTNTIVKVAAKDKVVEAPIEPEVEYVRDGEREVGTPNERVEGAKGKTVTTTTYDVDPKDGHITEHVGNPAVTPAGKTIVKVGAKTKVEQSKDSEGRDVIDTTTYEVDPKTGKVTPTTVRTYGTTKEPTVELEQDPKTGDVTVTPKKPDGSTYPPGTTVEIPGKGDKPITVTIGEDGKGKVPNSDLPNVEKTGTGKITEPGKSSVEVPKVTTFENDVLPGSIALPELMIEVRWIDEDENVLKPSVKTGNEKDAEHGSIPGYEFVRTVIDENETVITHIFRKVSGSINPNIIPVTPVLPDTNGNSGHDTPELTTPTPIPVTPVLPDANGNSGHDTPAPTTPIPDVVTPNADPVDTKTTNDNGAKSNDSQNVLPNTGTESNATLASLGLLGMLGGLGLALGKKKED